MFWVDATIMVQQAVGAIKTWGDGMKMLYNISKRKFQAWSPITVSEELGTYSHAYGMLPL